MLTLLKQKVSFRCTTSCRNCCLEKYTPEVPAKRSALPDSLLNRRPSSRAHHVRHNSESKAVSRSVCSPSFSSSVLPSMLGRVASLLLCPTNTSKVCIYRVCESRAESFDDDGVSLRNLSNQKMRLQGIAVLSIYCPRFMRPFRFRLTANNNM